MSTYGGLGAGTYGNLFGDEEQTYGDFAASPVVSGGPLSPGQVPTVPGSHPKRRPPTVWLGDSLPLPVPTYVALARYEVIRELFSVQAAGAGAFVLPAPMVVIDDTRDLEAIFHLYHLKS